MYLPDNMKIEVVVEVQMVSHLFDRVKMFAWMLEQDQDDSQYAAFLTETVIDDIKDRNHTDPSFDDYVPTSDQRAAEILLNAIAHTVKDMGGYTFILRRVKDVQNEGEC
jgi:hypothetical protein